MKIMKKRTVEADLRKALRALKLAIDIMDYCQGDKWERECTKEDREKFDKLHDELTGECND